MYKSFSFLVGHNATEKCPGAKLLTFLWDSYYCLPKTHWCRAYSSASSQWITPGWKGLSFPLTYRTAQHSVQPLWTACSRPPLSLGWKPLLHVFEPLRNILWPMSLFLLLHTPKKRIALPPPAGTDRLPSGFPKMGFFFQTIKPHTP